MGNCHHLIKYMGASKNDVYSIHPKYVLNGEHDLDIFGQYHGMATCCKDVQTQLGFYWLYTDYIDYNPLVHTCLLVNIAIVCLKNYIQLFAGTRNFNSLLWDNEHFFICK